MRTVQLTLRRLIFAVYLAFFAAVGLEAASSKSSSGGTVAVKGYYRKDGTYVAPHYRTAPNSTKNDNWSTRGNVNPYTGQPGTKPGDVGYTPPLYGPAPTVVAPSSAASAQPVAVPTVDPATRLALGMTREEVEAIMGKPRIKQTAPMERWGYRSAIIRFSADGKANEIQLYNTQ